MAMRCNCPPDKRRATLPTGRVEAERQAVAKPSAKAVGRSLNLGVTGAGSAQRDVLPGSYPANTAPSWADHGNAASLSARAAHRGNAVPSIVISSVHG